MRRARFALWPEGRICVIDSDTRQVPETEGCLSRLLAGAVLCALAIALVVTLTFPAHAQQTDRAKMLGQKLFCACGCTQVLTACNHVGCTRSTAMLKELDDRIARGDSDDLILQSFVQEYGETVLTEPPNKGFNRMAVIAPIVAPIAALLILWEVVRRWRQRAALVGAGGAPVSPELLARARAESEKGSGE
jgi:cytochrome c-type biogenesis protein CcmH